MLVMKIKDCISEGFGFADGKYVDSGIFINVLGGIIGISLLAYVFTTSQGLTSLKNAMLLSLIFLIFFLSLCINVVIRIKVPKGITTHNLGNLFSENEDPNASLYYYEKLMQKFAIIFGVIIIPLILFIISLVTENDDYKTCNLNLFNFYYSFHGNVYWIYCSFTLICFFA